MLTPAYKLTIGNKSVDSVRQPEASTAVELVVSLDIKMPADSFTVVLGQVDGLLKPALHDKATVELGTVAIPNKGDLVRLAFDNGDVNQAIIIGRLYNDSERPPLNNPNEVIFRLPWAKAYVHTVKAAIRNIESSDPLREVIVEMPPKITVRITDGTVRATAGKTEMKLDQPNGSVGTVTVFAGQTKITVNQDGDITVEAAGALTLQGTDDLTLQGQNIKINADLEVDIQAQTRASITATTGTTVDGGLSATLQETTISVNGISSFSP